MAFDEVVFQAAPVTDRSDEAMRRLRQPFAPDQDGARAEQGTRVSTPAP